MLSIGVEITYRVIGEYTQRHYKRQDGFRYDLFVQRRVFDPFAIGPNVPQLVTLHVDRVKGAIAFRG